MTGWPTPAGGGTRTGHGLVDIADAGAFLARLTRLDPAALVRLRPVPADQDKPPLAEMWGRVPWQALVTRVVAGRCAGDVTVSAAELLAVLAAGGQVLPERRDAAWRWGLPASEGRIVETVEASELFRVDAAAAVTLRAATGRRVGERTLRDALLDHVPIVVTDVDLGRVDVSQRLVQAVARMGFLGRSTTSGGGPVRVRVAGRWTGLIAPYGTAWLRDVNDAAQWAVKVHTNG